MSIPVSLVELMEQRYALSCKGITHIYSDENEIRVSYTELYNNASNLLYGLQSRGLKPGDELILQIEDNIKFLNVFWACILGGVTAVPISVGSSDEHRLKVFKIFEILNNPYLFTDEKTFQNLSKYAMGDGNPDKFKKVSDRTIFLEQLEEIKGQGILYKAGPDETAYIQFSSGSTGDPKGVVLTHENLVTNINGIAYSAAMDQNDSFLSWMPLTHDMGMIGYHLLPFALGIDQYIMPTSLFIRRPALWLKKASEHKATILSSPNFGYEYFMNCFSPEIASNWDLSHIRLIFNGAEPISVYLCNKFLDCMKVYGLKREAMYTVYGLAEASLAVAFPKPGKAFDVLCVDRRFLDVGQKISEIGSVSSDGAIIFAVEGYPIKDCFVRVCDEENRIFDEMTVGYVHISGKNVTRGYYNNKEATGRLITEDGWVNTGDLGFMKDGQLIITGRAKDVIFVMGQNYYPHDIERIAEEVEGIELGKVVACGVLNECEQRDDIVIFVYYKKSVEEFLPIAVRLKKHIGKKMGLNINAVVPVKRIPKTTSGKVQRYKLAEGYRDGEFTEIARTLDKMMHDQANNTDITLLGTETEKILANICADVLGIGSIGMNNNLLEHGGNSILLAQVHERIDKVFPGKLKVTDIFKYPTISMLAEFLDKKEKIKIREISLPGDYFVENREDAGECAYEFSLKGDVLNKLNSISQAEGTPVYDILISVYVYVLSIISERKDIAIQAITGKGELIPLALDLNSIQDFNLLFKTVNNKLDNEDGIPVNQIRNLDGLKLVAGHDTAISVIFYEKRLLYNSIEPADFFDIAIGTAIESDEAGFLFEHKSRRLKKERIRMHIDKYMDLIKMIADQYNHDTE